jgi:hypothetical protein
MKHTFKFLGLGAGIAVFSMINACSSGTTVKGSDAGNVDETGGVTAGGANSAGGNTNAGGKTSTSTSPNGTGGSTSTGSIVVLDAFNTLAQQQSFTPNTFVPTDCSVNVAAPNDAGGTFELDWSGSVDVNADSTTLGSMKVTATFTNWDQKWAVEMAAPTDAQGNPIDLTNKLVTADIKITSGLSPNSSYPFGAQLYVKTGTGYVWGASVWANVSALNTWVRLSLDTTAPDGTPAGSKFDPTLPRQIGIQLSTGGANESPYCAKNYAAAFGAPVTTVAYVDQVQVEPRP